jgi:hypothetical protein
MKSIYMILLIIQIFFSSYAYAVNLESNELVSPTAPNIASRPWYQRFDVTGFAAVGAVWTGKGGADPFLHLHAREVSLNIDAYSSEDVKFHIRWSLVPLTHEDDPISSSVQFPELNVQLNGNIFKIPNKSILLTVGRFAVPFSEEYLTHRSFDNSFLTNTVYFPYAFDNGIQLSGKSKGYDYALAVTDGSAIKSTQPQNTRSTVLRIRKDYSSSLHMSASFMNQGYTSTSSAMELGGGTLSATDTSIGGNAKYQMYHLDAKYDYSSNKNLKLGFGQATIEDQNSTSPDSSIKLMFFNIEPRLEVNESRFIALRYSRIQTSDSATGYQFKGEPFAVGDNYGFSSHSLSRTAIATGYYLDPKAVLKFEYSYDQFQLNDGVINQANLNRWFLGCDLAIKF